MTTDPPRPGVVERPLVAVRLVGPDARRFANNMFTNNVRDLPVGGANRHALTDDRGRVHGFLDLLCEADDRFVAIVDGLSSQAFVERFDKYIVFDDVELEPLDRIGRLVIGARAAEVVAAAGLPVPEAGRFAPTEDGFVWPLALGPTAGAGIGVATPPGVDLALDAETLSDEAYERIRVLAGHPAFPDDTGPKALPHELGLRDVVLSFDKGCYLGQESINRIDVMGQVKRHLRVIRLAGAVGDERDVVHDGKVVGQLTSPVAVDGVTMGLAILRQAAAEPGTRIQVGSIDGEVLVAPVSQPG